MNDKRQRICKVITDAMKTATWTAARKKLKQQFERNGITRCEKCGSAYPLGFAHRYKRRMITTEAETMTVALLCNPCHQEIEVSGHENMKLAIDAIIAGRLEQKHYFSDTVEQLWEDEQV